MRTDGSQRRRLTDGMGYDEYPDISPNGSKLVFDRTVGMGKSRIYVARANGSNAKPLTNTSSNSFEPWFCRVGRRSPSRAIVRAPSTRDS